MPCEVYSERVMHRREWQQRERHKPERGSRGSLPRGVEHRFLREEEEDGDASDSILMADKI